MLFSLLKTSATAYSSWFRGHFSIFSEDKTNTKNSINFLHKNTTDISFRHFEIFKGVALGPFLSTLPIRNANGKKIVMLLVHQRWWQVRNHYWYHASSIRHSLLILLLIVPCIVDSFGSVERKVSEQSFIAARLFQLWSPM